MARANVAALTVDDPRPGAYNIASGDRHTVFEMASAIANARPGRSQPEIVPRYRLGDVRHVFGATAAARAELGFTAEVTFEAGMQEFADAPLRHPGTARAPYPEQ